MTYWSAGSRMNTASLGGHRELHRYLAVILGQWFSSPPASVEARGGVHKNPAVLGPCYMLNRYVRFSRLPHSGDRSPGVLHRICSSPGKPVPLCSSGGAIGVRPVCNSCKSFAQVGRKDIQTFTGPKWVFSKYLYFTSVFMMTVSFATFANIYLYLYWLLLTLKKTVVLLLKLLFVLKVQLLKLCCFVVQYIWGLHFRGRLSSVPWLPCCCSIHI